MKNHSPDGPPEPPFFFKKKEKSNGDIEVILFGSSVASVARLIVLGVLVLILAFLGFDSTEILRLLR